LGYHARASHDLVAIEVCPVLVPPIVALLAPLGTASLRILERGERATFVITETETGIDLVVDMDRSPSLAAREVLAAFAEDHDLARVSWRRRDITEPIAWRRPALLNFAGVAVDLPPGAFIQASAVGEAAIRDAVIDEIEIADRIADLYAGCGTLSFPLAQVAQVWAVEGDAAMVAAINAAARAAGFSHRIVAECRDLARRPLVPEELDRFAAVVFDPPRAGARKQAEALAESAVPRVVAVSCDPGTFARDGRILLDGGYRLESVTPIDQFLWSAAVELVAVFRRSGPR
jgi:23S rRNA (uracil1939-C5)-methyltransferase